MGSRAYSRRSNGQFRRATIQNTFGIDAPVCPNPECRRFNPFRIGEIEPTTCHACGAPLRPVIITLSPARRARIAVGALTLTLAEELWASTLHGKSGWFGEDTDLRIAGLLGLDTGDGHDELTRCDYPGCLRFFWADDGARLLYESGRELEMCEAHAQPDDPFCRMYPGVGLEAVLRERDDAAYYAAGPYAGRLFR